MRHRVYFSSIVGLAFFIIFTMYGVWDKLLDAALRYISECAFYEYVSSMFVPVYRAAIITIFVSLTFMSACAILSLANKGDDDMDSRRRTK